MSYVEILKKLIALGDKAPQLFAVVMAIVEQIKIGLAIINGDAEPVALMGASAELAGFDVTAEELEAEAQFEAVMSANGPPMGAGGGLISLIGLARTLAKFIKEHPEYVDLIKSLLGK